ncbi:MAG: xanthine dehydrogenase family protein molybdopterin-binding subunit [Enhydrobacter sp.]|nr:MAG: xanthine dehydrogenase family protein molybdopterin-binding subunit [Enhydrobacter sp.]
MKSGIGVALPRLEDGRLLTGGGQYSDDFAMPGQAYAVVVRSMHAHARIVSVDADAASAMPGVLAILTAADLLVDGLKPIPHIPAAMSPPDIRLDNSDGSPHKILHPTLLATEVVRHVGEAVAFVVADTLAAAKDAAEAVEVEYEPLPALVEAAAAVGDPRRVAVDARVGEPDAVRSGFTAAAYVVRLSTDIQRVTGVPMEPRAALGQYEAATGRYTLHAGGGAVVRPKKEIALILGIEPARVRVIARDIGGNFGTRNFFFPEFALVCWAARRIGRPVKWVCERQEAFLSDYAGRDFHIASALALAADGTFLGLEATSISNVGAYTASFVPLTKGTQLMSSLYRLPAAARACGVLTNTPPTAPFRSAGRPEVMFVMERLIDLAARDHGFDRIELRRRNLIRDMPHTNSFGVTYDTGDYGAALDAILALSDWSGFGARRDRSRRNGLWRGIGIGGYVEAQSGAPHERAEVSVLPEGVVEIVIGTLSAGQGHATSFAQLASEWLGIAADKVRLVTDDSDRLAVGGGSHSGRSLRLAATTVHAAAQGIVAKGLKLAAQSFEADEGDISFADGRFTVRGTDRSVGLFELAARHGPLVDAANVDSRVGSYPYGWHVCEVEVDAATGVVRLDRYAAIDDVGRAVNPLILHGQTHGGIAQGAGQALMERCVYEPGSGQLLSASLLDYALPRADDLPAFVTALSEVPSTNHPLGFRGGGEGGITPALGVIVNAIVDALSELGVRHIDMPATPERVWRAIETAKRR